MKQKNINFKYFMQQVCRDCSPTFTVAYRFNVSDPSPAGCTLAPCPRLGEKNNKKKGCICMHKDTHNSYNIYCAYLGHGGWSHENKLTYTYSKLLFLHQLIIN